MRHFHTSRKKREVTMSSRIKSNRHRFGILGGAAVLAAVAVAATFSNQRLQGAGLDVFRVEEDWELVVGDADYFIDGPQVTCTISPLDMTTAYCAFDINYHTQPDYLPGGLQIHTWDPTDPIAYANSTHTGVMSSSNEVVTWTQTMTLDPNTSTITFQVINGQSQTWNNFGGSNGNSGHLTLGITTALANLNGYDPNVSLDNSGVSFASNLVVSQTLIAIRWFDVNGNLLAEFNSPQIVHPQQ
jgi:hypothetical protein